MPPTNYKLFLETFIEDERFFKHNAPFIEEYSLLMENRAAHTESVPSESGTSRTTSSRQTILSPARIFLCDLPKKGFAYTLGRDPGCDVVIPFATVSRKHLRIFLDKQLGSWILHALSRTVVGEIELFEGGQTLIPLRFDKATKVTVSGYVLHVRPQWIGELNSFSPELAGMPNLTIESEIGTKTATQTISSRPSDASRDFQEEQYYILKREAWRGAPFAQDMRSSRLLAAEKVLSREKAIEGLSWRKDLDVRLYLQRKVLTLILQRKSIVQQL